MNQKVPIPFIILGWIVIITIPTAFFIFGWRDIQLNCQRHSPGAPPTCQISESFAMGLHTRQVTAAQINGISFQTRQSSSAVKPGRGGGSTLTSTLVFDTPNGELPISRVSSNVDTVAKRELIQKMREFLASPDSLEFRHHARMHSIFGYLGGLGVAGLVFILLSVIWYQLRRLLGWTNLPR